MARPTSPAAGEALRTEQHVSAAAPSARAASTAWAARSVWLILGAALLAVPFLDTRLWPLAWLGLLPLFALAPRAATLRHAATDGLLTGFVVNVIGFHWLVTTIHVFGAFPLPLAVAFFAVLSLYASLPFVLVAVALRWAG
ncbi:MAG: hypothetical protein AB1689_10655, partial [Thermodesulfobacteriota bacterium]